MHLESDYSDVEEYGLHIKNGSDVSEKNQGREYRPNYKKERRGKNSFNGMYRRSNRKVHLLNEPEEINHPRIKSPCEANGNGNGSPQPSNGNIFRTYVTFPIIINGDERHKILYSTMPIEEILFSHKLEEFPLIKQTDSIPKYYIYLEGYHKQEVKNYQIAINRMNSILEANSNLMKIIEETYSRDFFRI